MKKIFLGIIVGVLVACTGVVAEKSNSGIPTKYISGIGYKCQVHLITIKDHDYIMVIQDNSYGGTAIIHAEHCKCKRK